METRYDMEDRQPLNAGYGYPQQGSNEPGRGDLEGGAPRQGYRQTVRKVTPMTIAFFAAGASLMLGALISAVVLLFSGELVDMFEMLYMFLFGGVLALDTTPYCATLKGVREAQDFITKYIALLTRLTGRGVVFLFLGCSLFTSMWMNLEGDFFRFLAVVLNLYVMLVGIYCITMGAKHSMTLNKVKQKFQQEHSAGGQLEQRYAHFAQAYPLQVNGQQNPNTGLTQKEFNKFTEEVASIKFPDGPLELIFNALVSNPSWRSVSPEEKKLPFEDLKAWLTDQGVGMVFL